MRAHGLWVLPLVLAGTSSPLFAADTSAPTKPVVTDDGAYTTAIAQLHATWTSSDPESGIAEYQYLIRQDSTSGAIIVNWTSTGTTASVTRTGLSLLQGKWYYFQVKAKNGAGLWSAVGSSNGIKVDTTAPTAPGLLQEGSSTTDLDYDDNGSYTVYWVAASDGESGISFYEVQERVGSSGSWTSLTNSRTSTNFSVSGRLDKTTYFYQVCAKNKAGLWGPWSSVSDGILVDKTVPSAVTVIDDGVTTYSATSLRTTWTTSSDAESGIVDYQYRIRQDSTSGTVIVDWTSVGLSIGVTKTGLSLIVGKKYYVGVRAKNGAGLYSSARYSDGITVQADALPPTVESVFPTPGPGLYAGDTITISAAVTDTDPSPLEYQFSIDGAVKQAWSAASTYQWMTTVAMEGPHAITVEARDAGGATSSTQTRYLYRKPPGPP